MGYGTRSQVWLRTGEPENDEALLVEATSNEGINAGIDKLTSMTRIFAFRYRWHTSAIQWAPP